MKKIIAISLLALCLIGCEKKAPDQGQKQFVIGFSQCTDDLWRQIMEVQMQTAVDQYPELKIQIENAHGNTFTQIAQIKKFIKNKVNLIIVSPNEAEPLTPIMEEAYRKGIPTIIWDRRINSDQYTSSVSADNYLIGQDVARLIQTSLPPGSTILEITGLMGSSPAIDRHNGFLSGVSHDYNVRTINGDWMQSVTKAAMQNMKDFNDISAVFAHNDDMAMAAYDVISERDPLKARSIEFIGVDALVGLDAVLDGRLYASFLYPTGGDKVIEVARKILHKEPVQKHYTLQSLLVDASNAYTLKAQQKQIISYQEQINVQKNNIASTRHYIGKLKMTLLVVIVFTLLVMGLAAFMLYLNYRLRRKNNSLSKDNEDIENETKLLGVKHAQMENIAAQRLQYFTNITHEIRTPLTLILNPLDKIIQKEKSPEIQHNLLVVQRNAKYLLQVVNQILDFRKIENNKMSLSLSRIEIVSFVREILSYFEVYAETENIVYKFSSDIPSQEIFIDPDKIEQVIMNLLSNAFKYCSRYGTIEVSIVDNVNSIFIRVKDNGRGIAKENLQKIFDRFYSFGKSNTVSTGIGLNLSREYVNLHHGQITVDSIQGAYTIFSVELLKGDAHFKGDSNVEWMPAKTNYLEEKVMDEEKVTALLNRKENETILIAEDEQDILAYLTEELSMNFNVIAVNNGLDAVNAVNNGDISLVLSDILMPKLNGFQVCSSIKSNFATCHIPVILLTALSDDNQKIFSIAEGADEYIRKPFDIKYLKMKIIQILDERKRLVKSFALKYEHDPSASIDTVSCVDDSFKNSVFGVLEKYHTDSDFHIEMMGDILGLSRVQLYRKISTIFGIAPSDLLRDYRLRKSIGFLKDKSLTISEVAYQVGFSSPAYFAKCFKNSFDITPTAYREKPDNTTK
jgi:signal transduction histidine kinase/CheY-like chemotaxis protein/AraC-like DNA-binding protein/ABC-type xylose transport system substrate-binding protein